MKLTETQKKDYQLINAAAQGFDEFFEIYSKKNKKVNLEKINHLHILYFQRFLEIEQTNNDFFN